MMTVTEMLEKAFEDGRVHLEKMNDGALLRSYRKYKYNKIIGQALLAEMKKRGGFWIVEKIEVLEGRLRGIRKQVKETGDMVRWWDIYQEVKKDLEELDPYSKELDIGIYGKPFGSGLADQSEGGTKWNKQ